MEQWISKEELVNRIMTKKRLLGQANAFTIEQLEKEIQKYEKRHKVVNEDEDEIFGLYPDDYCCKFEYKLPTTK
jgi:hypothetical protein